MNEPVHYAPQIEAITVTPGYFEAMGIPVVAGRTFADSDPDQGHTRPVILNEAAVVAIFGGTSAVGKRIQPNLPVVGVVGNAKTRALNQEAGPVLYRLYSGGPISFVLRTNQAPTPLVRELQQRAHALDLKNAATLRDWVNHSIGDERSRAILTTTAGVMLFVLALIGTTGITAHAVARRRKEWAVRLALGANATGVVRHIILGVVRVVALGGVAGLVLGVGLGRRRQCSVLDHAHRSDAGHRRVDARHCGDGARRVLAGAAGDERFSSDPAAARLARICRCQSTAAPTRSAGMINIWSTQPRGYWPVRGYGALSADT